MRIYFRRLLVGTRASRGSIHCACPARGLTVMSGAGYRLLCDERAGALFVSVAREPKGFACRRLAYATGYAIGAEALGTAAEAFASKSVRKRRRLVRRKFVLSIATAWVITVPASALLAATIYGLLQLL